MKRKTMTLVLCLLAALALVSVGFASWVISADATDNVEGQIIVETVDDRRLTITASTNEQFVFGAPTTNKENAWLTNTTKESLTITINVTIGKKDSSNEKLDLSKVNLTAEISELTGNYQQAVEAGYVCAINDATIVPEGTGENRTIKITIKWGTHWGTNTNPYDYFNSKDINAKVPEKGETTYGDLAKTELTEMYNLLNKVKFTIKVTAK